MSHRSEAASRTHDIGSSTCRCLLPKFGAAGGRVVAVEKRMRVMIPSATAQRDARSCSRNCRAEANSAAAFSRCLMPSPRVAGSSRQNRTQNQIRLEIAGIQPQRRACRFLRLRESMQPGLRHCKIAQVTRIGAADLDRTRRFRH